ncbi:hypothetical protein [Crossiella sp. NPDC003009]
MGGELRLARAEVLPLRTKFATDPLRALLSAATGLGPQDAVRVRILARPVTGLRLARARRRATRLRTGRCPAMIGSLRHLLTPTVGHPTPQ